MRRTFFKYISLNMLGALGLSGYIMADTFFVANRLGADGLAALNLAIPIFGLINGLGILLGIGGATRYSICRYQGDADRANRTFTLALLTGLGLGIILTLLGAFCARPVALLLGANTDTCPCVPSTCARCFSSPPASCSTTLWCVLSATTATPSWP